MKLDIIKQIILIIFIVANIYNVNALRKFSAFQNTSSVTEVDSFLSRGFSYIIQDKEINQFPESPLSAKKIFSYDTNILNNILPNLLYSDEKYRFTINRNITEIMIDEMKKNAQITVGGDFFPTVNSGLYQIVISHLYRRQLATQLTNDNMGIKYIIPNHDKNFPSLSKDIITDSYKKFYIYPNTVQANGTFSDFMNDDNLIQGTFDFFIQYGTHYISEYTMGYRAGFNREYRNNNTFLINKDGKIPNTDLKTFLSFLEKSEKVETVKAEEKKESANMKNFLKKESVNPPPVPIGKSKPAPKVPNGPSNDFDANNPDSSLDDDSILSSSIDKPEDNTIIKNSLTALGNNTSSESNRYQFIVDEPAKKAPYPAPPIFAHFSVGECELNNYFIKSNRCNKKNPRLIRYKITPIYKLFDPFFQTKTLFKADNIRIGLTQMNTIHRTLRRMFHFIQEALNPNLFVITEIFSNSYERNAPGTWNKCLQDNPSVFETIRRKYRITTKKKTFSKEALLMNKVIPVISIKNYATPKKGFEIISSKEKSMYWCLKHEHNMHPEDLKNGSWRNRKYVVDIQLIVENDNIPFVDSGYECTETWEFTDAKKDLTRWHFCVKYVRDFANPMLVTDVKIFEFQKVMGKCFHNNLVVWNNGKKYFCNCEINLQNYSDDEAQMDKDVFFCHSRKNDLYYKPIIPNKPLNSKGKFSKIKK